jgi:hypothetical protein
MATASFEAAALAYAERLRWAVFPCLGKTPAIKGGRGCLDATTDREAIQHWWNQFPNANIGVATGERSGFWVLDIDERKGGEDSLNDLIRERGPLPETVEQLTGGGGRHLLFQHVAGVGNRTAVRPGIDVRGVAGYVIAAPSIHPETRRPYAWEVDHHPLEVPVAPAPEWLIELVRDRAPLDLNGAIGQASPWLEMALGPVAEGRRNDTATRLAGHLLRRYVEPRLAYALLSAWNAAHCCPPLSQVEFSRTYNSVLALEMRRRRSVR